MIYHPIKIYTSTVVATALALTMAGTGTVQAADAFSFALLADGPYGEPAESGYDNLIEDVNADESVQFVIHAGDIKSGGEVCTDELLTRRFNQFQQFDKPFIYTPGDNEWTDCHRTSNGSYLPTERLNYIRQLFFPQPDMSTGQNPMPVSSQSSFDGFEQFVENTLFVKENVVFAQLHVVGSNNNLAPWNQIDANDTLETPRTDRLQEYNSRRDANLAWLNHTFDTATQQNAAGVFLTMQANPRFDLNREEPGRNGFNEILDALLARATQFGKPVVLAHGDFHIFLIDTPRLVPWYANADATSTSDNRTVPNLTRVQTFGDSENHWIKVTVDPDSESVFQMTPQIVTANTTPSNEINLKGSVYSSTALELFWNRVYFDEVETRYELSRDGEVLTTTDAISSFEQNLKPGTTYQYVIKAIDSTGEVRTQAMAELTTNSH